MAGRGVWVHLRVEGAWRWSRLRNKGGRGCEDGGGRTKGLRGGAGSVVGGAWTGVRLPVGGAWGERG